MQNDKQDNQYRQHDYALCFFDWEYIYDRNVSRGSACKYARKSEPSEKALRTIPLKT